MSVRSPVPCGPPKTPCCLPSRREPEVGDGLTLSQATIGGLRPSPAHLLYLKTMRRGRWRPARPFSGGLAPKILSVTSGLDFRSRHPEGGMGGHKILRAGRFYCLEIGFCSRLPFATSAVCVYSARNGVLHTLFEFDRHTRSAQTFFHLWCSNPGLQLVQMHSGRPLLAQDQRMGRVEQDRRRATDRQCAPGNSLPRPAL